MDHDFEQLLRSQLDQDSAALRQTGDRLRRHFRRWLFENYAMHMNSTGHTERMHQLLALWLDLQRAWHSATREASPSEPPVPPWECADQEVARLWQAITNPANQRALEEWLFQSEGPSIEWARRALQFCRERAQDS